VIAHFLLVLALLAQVDGYKSYSELERMLAWGAGLLLTAPLFAMRYCRRMARPDTAQLVLMRPGSAFEKWLLAFVVVGVAYPLAYQLVFAVNDIPAAWIAEQRAADALSALGSEIEGEAPELEFERIDLEFSYRASLAVTELGWKELVPMTLLVLGLQGFVLTGSLWFRRWPFAKTVVAGLLVGLACLLARALVGEGDSFSFWREVWTEVYFDESSIAPVEWVLFPLAWFGVPAGLWCAAWFALREREVA
jgi:hypothetical protein